MQRITLQSTIVARHIRCVAQVSHKHRTVNEQKINKHEQLNYVSITYV